MQGFKNFVRQDDEVKESLKKLPKDHSKFLKDFEFRFQIGNTLKGDDGHVGMIETKPKRITIAAPWNYGREFTLFHEVGHIIWEMLIKNKEFEKEWKSIVKKNKNRKKEENDEENWCHAYAAAYCKSPPFVHHNEDWIKFVNKISKIKLGR